MSRPTYSIKGQRINFNELRAQARRSEIDTPKKPSSKPPEDEVENQVLLGGFTPAPMPETVVEAAPAPAPVAAPAAPAAPRPVLKPVVSDKPADKVDE